MYTCIWSMFVFMSVVVTVCGNVCCVSAVVKDSVFSHGVLNYVVCLCKRCDGCCVFCLYCEAWSCRYSCMNSSCSKCTSTTGALNDLTTDLVVTNNNIKYECFVMQMLYVCVLCASYGSSQYCILHDLQYVNAGRRCKRRPYGRDILQSRYHSVAINTFYVLVLICYECVCYI